MSNKMKEKEPYIAKLYKDFGKKLRKAREARFPSAKEFYKEFSSELEKRYEEEFKNDRQKESGKKSLLAYETYVGYENGQRFPNAWILKNLARFLEISTDELLGIHVAEKDCAYLMDALRLEGCQVKFSYDGEKISFMRLYQATAGAWGKDDYEEVFRSVRRTMALYGIKDYSEMTFEVSRKSWYSQSEGWVKTDEFCVNVPLQKLLNEAEAAGEEYKRKYVIQKLRDYASEAKQKDKLWLEIAAESLKLRKMSAFYEAMDKEDGDLLEHKREVEDILLIKYFFNIDITDSRGRSAWKKLNESLKAAQKSEAGLKGLTKEALASIKYRPDYFNPVVEQLADKMLISEALSDYSYRHENIKCEPPDYLQYISLKKRYIREVFNEWRDTYWACKSCVTSETIGRVDREKHLEFCKQCVNQNAKDYYNVSYYLPFLGWVSATDNKSALQACEAWNKENSEGRALLAKYRPLTKNDEELCEKIKEELTSKALEEVAEYHFYEEMAKYIKEYTSAEAVEMREASIRTLFRCRDYKDEVEESQPEEDKEICEEEYLPMPEEQEYYDLDFDEKEYEAYLEMEAREEEEYDKWCAEHPELLEVPAPPSLNEREDLIGFWQNKIAPEILLKDGTWRKYNSLEEKRKKFINDDGERLYGFWCGCALHYQHETEDEDLAELEDENIEDLKMKYSSEEEKISLESGLVNFFAIVRNVVHRQDYCLQCLFFDDNINIDKVKGNKQYKVWVKEELSINRLEDEIIERALTKVAEMLKDANR